MKNVFLPGCDEIKILSQYSILGIQSVINASSIYKNQDKFATLILNFHLRFAFYSFDILSDWDLKWLIVLSSNETDLETSQSF